LRIRRAADDDGKEARPCAGGGLRPGLAQPPSKNAPTAFPGGDLQYIAAHGAPANLTGFIERLRSEGVLTKTRFGKKYPMWWRRSKLFRAVARENK
jgi:hypothetical protein